MSERILLVQLADIGDLITTTPALAALRQARPDAHLTLLTTAHAAPIVDNDLVNHVITVDRQSFNSSYAMLLPANLRRIWSLRAGDYDSVVFFHHFTLKLGTLKFWWIAQASGAQHVLGIDNGNGWFLTERLPDEGYGAKHQAQYWLDLVSLLGADPSPQRARIGFHGGVLPLAAYRGKRIIIHAGSGGYSPARRWNPQAFAQVADALHEQFDAQIVLVGTPDDDADAVAAAMTHTPINLSGKTTLTQLADVIRSADVYIGADSGVLHVAASVRTPVVALFGPSNHEAWSPWSPGGRAIVLRSAPECSPCSYVEHSVGARQGCAAKTCMKMITPAQVINAATHLLHDDDYTPPVSGFPHDVRGGQRDWSRRINILGLPVDNITYDEWMKLIDKWVTRGTRTHHVCTTNPEFMMIAQGDAIFEQVLKRADLCIPDGTGLLWAADILKTPLRQRVTGSDGTVRIAREAAKRGWKLFLLGAAPGVADEAAALMREHLPGIQVVGTYSGSPAPNEEAAIVERVNATGADILLVAYGAPEQDKWIARNMPRLNVKMAMGVGGALDFVAGRVPRAPEWMQRQRIEWLYRLYKQPWRIRRMLRLPRFVLAVIMRGAD